MNGKIRFPTPMPSRSSFTYTDICSGIGGMRLAFDNLGGKCVFSSENDGFCQKTYYENFGIMPSGDITKIPISSIPRHDILLAGFPCQPFSKGGYATRNKLGIKNGFEDSEQGSIFFHIAKIISKKKPKAVFLENVPKLEKYENGNALKTILRKLKNLGYSVSYKIINSDGLVPQRRQRLYIVALLGETQFIFPDIPYLEPKLKNILETNIDKKYILSDKLWGWLQNHAKKHAKKGNGFGFRMADPEKTTCTLSARYHKDGSEILIPRRNGNPRKLTPRECARLMGFPEEFRISVSNTQAYKQFGNSVIVPIIYLIGFEIVKNLKQFQNNPIKLIAKSR